MATQAPTPIQNSISADLERGLREIQTSSHTGPPGDLDDKKKRWLVVGICLHSILAPALRKYVDPVVTNLYSALLLSDQIDLQTQPTHRRTYGVEKIYLNYEAINNNKTTHGYCTALYDYKVQNAVDLSKLFLQTHMAHYTAFDGSCDSSALFGMINRINKFPLNVRTAANNVRSYVRNEWAHCNFTVWDDVKYVQSLQLIEDFIYLLNLDAADEKEMIEELDKWRKNGTNFLQGYTISFELVNEIRQQLQLLVEYAEVISKTADQEFVKVQKELKDIGETLSQHEQRISTLENTVSLQGKALEEYGSLNDADIPEIDQWKHDSKAFIETNIFKDILEILEDHHCLILTGVSGMGKTLTAQNIALKLSDEKGYKVEPCINVKDIKRRYKQNVRQVFFVDDICGKYAANIKDIENWIKMMKFVKHNLVKGKTKILATCRTEVFNEESFQDAFDFFKKDVYELTVKYSIQDKIKVARKYLKKNDKILLDIFGKVEFSPFMCFLYSQHGKFEINEFLNSPFKTFCMEWKLLKSLNKEKFCVLLLCVIYNGTIHEAIFDVPNDSRKEERKMIKDIFECCKLGRDTSRSTIKDQLHACVDTYFIKVDKEYKVIHDKMFDFLCCYFGKIFIAPILKFADDKLIRERVQLESIQKTPAEFTIMVSSIDEQKYKDRLRMDLFNGKIHLCLNNSQMRYKEYRDKFLDVFRDLDNDLKRSFINTKDDNGMTTFIVSCLRGFADLIDYFITIGANIDVQNGLFTPLTAACRDGHLQTVKSLLDKGAAINKTNLDGETPLYTACFGGHYDLVKILIEKGADINKRNIYNHTPLYVSSLEGHKNIVNMLIENGANVFKCSDSLIGATNGGHDKIVETLITKDFDVNIVDMQGRTALAIACEEGYTKIVTFLVDNNADVNMLDIERETCLHKAYRNGSVGVIQTLLAKRVDVNITNRKGQTPADVSKTECTIMDGVLLNTSEDFQLEPYKSFITTGTPKETSYQHKPDTISELLRYKWTPLYAACMHGDIGTVKSLIKNRANVNKKTDSGEPPLVAACQQGHGILIQMLQDEGADTYQALLSAVQRDKERAVQILICKGIYSGFKRGDFGYKGGGWKWLMEVACKHESTKVVGFLLQKSADVVLSDKHTTICTACTNEFHQIVELLIKKGPEFNYRCNKDEKTPLYSACKKRFNRVVEMLIENGVDFKKADGNGTTLFHYACYEDNLDLIQLLTDKGFGANKPDKYGKYPLYVAMNNGFDDLSEFLVQKGCPIALSEDDKKKVLITVFESGSKILSTLLVSNGYTNNLANFTEILLYHTCRLGLFATTQNFFENRFKLTTIYKYGYTPLILADIAGNDYLAQCILSVLLNDDKIRLTSFFNKSNPVTYFRVQGYHKRVKTEHMRGSSKKYEILFQVCMNGLPISIIEKNFKTVNINIFFEPKDPYDTIWFQQTPLCLAVRRGHRKVVELLLKHGANVDLTIEGCEDDDVFSSTIRYGYTPLFAACQRKYYEIVDMLLEGGANLNKALYDACREGYLDTIQFLLQKGADVNSVCRFGQTAVHAACIGGHYTIVKYLLDQGALVETKLRNSSIFFNHEITCLDFVYACSNHRILKLLIERGASINTLSECGRILLHTACKEGNYKTVERLMDTGVDINASDKFGSTPLHACILPRKRNDHSEDDCRYNMVRKISHSFQGSLCYMREDNAIEHYSADELMSNIPSNFRRKLTDNRYKVVQLLIKNGADINKVDSKNRSPLTCARDMEDMKLVEMLLTKG